MVEVVTFPIHSCSKDIGGLSGRGKIYMPNVWPAVTPGHQGMVDCVSLLVVIGDEGSFDDSDLVPFFLV
jgi:hypothetical protein